MPSVQCPPSLLPASDAELLVLFPISLCLRLSKRFDKSEFRGQNSNCRKNLDPLLSTAYRDQTPAQRYINHRRNNDVTDFDRSAASILPFVPPPACSGYEGHPCRALFRFHPRISGRLCESMGCVFGKGTCHILYDRHLPNLCACGYYAPGTVRGPLADSTPVRRDNICAVDQSISAINPTPQQNSALY